VRFHASCADAENAGFRPCQRCKPQQPSAVSHHAEWVIQACRFIEADAAEGRAPTLDALAARLGLSSSHLHRIFKQATGLTPKAYAAAQREQRVRSALGHTTDSVTEAIYGAGMTPARYRAGGAAQRIHFAVAQCSLGALLVAHSGQGLCAILLGDDPDVLVRDLQDRFAQAQLVGGDAGFELLVAQVVAFVEAPGRGLDLPLDVRGTAFQQRVWQALRTIPPGQTASYAEIAARIGAPAATRAVAQACGANALAVAIPCHRVVRSDGALSGYRWGVERKRALLERESGAAAPTRLQEKAA
jgi:AraC family transcriptional regulator of adaptative response/methylated-DNA-[protein]-cysteine methyltransferase